MKRAPAGLGVLLALALAGCAGRNAGDGKLTAITVVGGDGSAATTPFFAAIRQGFFKKAGLDVSYATLSGGSTSMDAALDSAAVDVGIGAGTQWLSDAAKGALNGKIIGEIADNNYVILGGQGITDVRQMSGKTFGVSNYNAGDHLYAKAVLSHFGVAPASVTWLAVGNPGGRLATLRAGKVAGVEMPLTNLPADEVPHVLVGADNSPFPFVSNAIFARQGFIDAHRAALGKFLAAIGEGASWVRTHPAEAIPACRDTGSTEATCKTAIKTALASKNPYTWSSTTRVNMTAIDAMVPIVSAVVPNAKKLTAGAIVDASLAGGRS